LNFASLEIINRKMTTPSSWHLRQNPTIYQGWRKTKNYFEGWYFKIVDPDQNLAFALIPGLSKSSDAHAFIQFIDGVNCESQYHRFPLESFSPMPDKFEIKIEEQEFSEEKISFQSDELSVELIQSPHTKLASSLLSPGIMGWYSYMPFMQCYHGLVSMNHHVSGKVRIGQKHYQLNAAKCYVEKDWGVSFPKAWIWNQCNTFKDNNELSIFASVAHIPWLGSYFIGFIAAIFYKGEIEVFATYNNSKRKTHVKGNHVFMSFKKKNKILEIESVKEEGAMLKSPIQGEMVSKVNESLLATMRVTYAIGNKKLVEDTGTYSGLELAGPVDILMH